MTYVPFRISQVIILYHCISFQNRHNFRHSILTCTVDNCHVTDYIAFMIKTFANKETQIIYVSGKSKRLPVDLIKRAIRRLEYIDHAKDINDLKVPPSNRLHALKGNREGQFSISINDQWRICFRFFEGDAYDVEITDYH